MIGFLMKNIDVKDIVWLAHKISHTNQNLRQLMLYFCQILDPLMCDEVSRNKDQVTREYVSLMKLHSESCKVDHINKWMSARLNCTFQPVYWPVSKLLSNKWWTWINHNWKRLQH